MFAAHLQRQGLRSSTIKTYLSAISNVHKLLGQTDPTNTFLVNKMVQGIVNTESKSEQTRLPITNTELHKIMQAIPFCTGCTYTQIMLEALCLLAYHACLRVGEIVYSAQREHTLTMDNLNTTEASEFQITLSSYKHSKTTTPTLILQKQPTDKHCPVKSLQKYLLIRGAAPGPIFINKMSQPLTRENFAHYLNLCLQLAGLPAEHYNTHSLRIGRATQLAIDGASEMTIKAAGRRKSTAYQKYVHPTVFHLPK